MAVCRLVGWIFLGAALLAIGAEIVRSLEAAHWAPLTLGELWRGLDRGGLDAELGRWAAPAAAALGLPAWLPALGLAALLFWICRRRRFRRRR